MIFLSFLLPQFKCRSLSFRPKRVSFLHSQCCSWLLSSHSKRMTFTQSLMASAPRQSWSLRLRTRDSEAQRNCWSLACGSHRATVTEVGLSTLMHFLWFSLKIRKDPVSETEEESRGSNFGWVFHWPCIFRGGHIPIAAVIRKTCRSPRTTAELKHGSIVLGAVSSKVVDEAAESFQDMGNVIFRVHRCVT